ncbi:DUF2726 domain-containing protein [Marinobacter hydrocarbonoclasticus]|nr:DUF2726 domain-containing protein [Marinobacter nauticus]
MTAYLLILFGLVVALITALWWRSRPSLAQGAALTHQERTFQAALQTALDALSLPLRPFAKVKIADVLAPGRGQYRQSWLARYAELQEATFDFVLCDAQSLKIEAAIALDTGQRSLRTRDQLLDTACQQTGLPLLRFPAQRHYPQAELQDALRSALAHRVPTDDSTPLVSAPVPPTSLTADLPQTIEHLSTEEFAARMSLHPRALLAMLARLGYLEWDDHGQLQLTDKGRRKGAVQWQGDAERRQFQWSVRDPHRAGK